MSRMSFFRTTGRLFSRPNQASFYVERSGSKNMRISVGPTGNARIPYPLARRYALGPPLKNQSGLSHRANVDGGIVSTGSKMEKITVGGHHNHFQVGVGGLGFASLLGVSGYLLWDQRIAQDARHGLGDLPSEPYSSSLEQPPSGLNNIIVPGGLDNLYENQYQEKLSALMKDHRVICVHGPGGSGKSTLVKSEALKQKSGVFIYQITASSDDALMRGLIELHIRLYGASDHFTEAMNDESVKRERLLTRLKTKMSEHGKSALLLLDNCREESDLLRQTIDTLCETRILLTTRKELLIDFPSAQHLFLNAGWGVEEKLQFLEGLGSPKECHALAEYLPFPLGLKIAAQTIRYRRRNPQRGYDCATYLSELKEGRSNDPQTAVLREAIRSITHQEAKLLLQFLSVLSPQPVPMGLVNAYFESLFKQEGDDRYLDVLDQAMNQLRYISLIDEGLEKGELQFLQMHESLQDIVRNEHPVQALSWLKWLRGDKNTLSSILSILTQSLEVDERRLNKKTYKHFSQALQIHAEAFSLNCHKPSEHHQNEIKFSLMYFNLGTSYFYFGLYAEAKETLERALAIKELHYDAGHPEIAKTLIHLGNAYGFLGQADQQKMLLERALGIFEAHYDADRPEIAVTLTGLGIAYADLGQADQQKELLERALVINEAYYNAGHPAIAKTLTNLGNAYGALGQAEQQKELLERTLAIFETHYDVGHPEIAKTLTNLSNACGALGQADQQKELLERALLINEAYYDADHPEIAKTLTGLGNAYGALGQAEQEKELLERALVINEAYYDADHPEIAITLANLAMARTSLGELDQAQSDLLKAQSIFDTYYGSDHSYTKQANEDLGKINQLIQDKSENKPSVFRDQTTRHQKNESPPVEKDTAPGLRR